MTPLVIVHRAAVGSTENTLAGIRRATAVSADAVEFDVRCTLQGEVLLHHDRSLWRLARIPLPLRLLPGAVARRVPVVGGGRLALLSEALEALPPHILAAVDIKERRAAEATLRAVRDAGMESHVMLWTRDVAVARRLAGEAKEIEVALLRDARSPGALRRFLEDACASGVRAVSAHWDVAQPEFVAEAHRLGLRMYAMARHPQAQRSGLEAGIDGIVTRWPLEARAIVESFGGA